MPHLSDPPGPPGHWLLGNVREFRTDMLAFYTRLAREYGDVVAYRLGPRRSFLISHPDLIEQVLVTDNRNFIKNFGIRLLRPTIGDGLLLNEGDAWLRQRRLIQPLFARQQIESYIPLIVTATQRLLESWQPGETRDLHAEMMKLTLAIVSQTLLGSETDSNSQAVNDAACAIQADFNSRFQSAFPVPFWLPHPRNYRLRQQVRRLDAILQDVIRQRRVATSGRGDLLSCLMQARDAGDQTGMTDRQLRDEVMTIFLAGHETTANALAWIWYLLGQHPQVLARLAAEFATILGERLPGADDLPQLSFAEQVVLESMRLYPPAYVIGRQPVRDCDIGGYHIPAGSSVMMSQWVVHRDPRFFARPDEFDPDRWADAGFRKQARYAYFPFGGGPRVCIGNSFAIMEAILVLATIVPRFRCSLAGPLPIVPAASVTLRPHGGIPVTLSRPADRRESAAAQRANAPPPQT